VTILRNYNQIILRARTATTCYPSDPVRCSRGTMRQTSWRDLKHPLTDAGLAQFLADWERCLSRRWPGRASQDQVPGSWRAGGFRDRGMWVCQGWG
jgi:hypothetical protein